MVNFTLPEFYLNLIKFGIKELAMTPPPKKTKRKFKKIPGELASMVVTGHVWLLSTYHTAGLLDGCWK